MKREVSVILFAFAYVSALSAATCTWTGGGDGSTWDDARNWENSQKPTAGDSVVLTPTVAHTYVVNDMGAMTLESLTLSGSVSYRFESTGALTLTGENPFNWTATGAVTNAAPFVLPAGENVFSVSTSAANVVFTGAFSGEGILKINGSSSSTTVWLYGASSHAGTKLTGATLRGCNVNAFGRDGATLSTTESSGQIYFDATGDWRCNYYSTQSTAVNFNKTCNFYGYYTNTYSSTHRLFVQNGCANLHFYNDVAMPNGIFYPNPHNTSTIHFHEPVHFKNVSSGSSLSGGYGWTVFYASGNVWDASGLPLAYSLNVRCAGDNVLVPGAAIRWTGDRRSGMCTMDLYGHDQEAAYLTEPTLSTALDSRYLDCSTGAATLTLTGSESAMARCLVKGATTLVWNPSGSECVQTLTGRVNTTTGDLMVSNGTFRILGDTTFANVPKVVVGPNGTLLMDATPQSALSGVTEMVVDGHFAQANGAAGAFGNGTMNLRLGPDATFEIPAGQTIEVNTLYVNGFPVEADDYSGSGGSAENVLDQISGAGLLVVRTSGSEIVASSATWDGGGGANESIAEAANWDGNAVPDLTSSGLTATFATGGANADFDRVARFAGVNFKQGLFNFSSSSPSARIDVYGGGINAESFATNRVDVPVRLCADLALSVTNNAELHFDGKVSSSSPYTYSVNRAGDIHLHAANDFSGTINMTDGKIHVWDDMALGTCAIVNTGKYNEREPQLVLHNVSISNSFRAMGGTTPPFRIEEGTTNTFHGPFESWGSIRPLFARKSVTVFAGGVDNHSYDFAMRCQTGYSDSALATIVISNKPYVASNVNTCRFGSMSKGGSFRYTLRLAAPGNYFGDMYVEGGSSVTLDCDDALAPTNRLAYFGGNGYAQSAIPLWGGTLDLNGHDATLAHVSSVRPAAGETAPVVLSSTAATLTISGTEVGTNFFVCAGQTSLAASNSTTLVLGAVHTTVGDLSVAGAATMEFLPGGSWAQGTNVTVCGMGTLKLPESGTIGAQACIYLDDDATIDIAEGVEVKVQELYINGRRMSYGTYGGPESSACKKIEGHFTGKGCVKVRGAGPGFVISFF